MARRGGKRKAAAVRHTRNRPFFGPFFTESRGNWPSPGRLTPRLPSDRLTRDGCTHHAPRNQIDHAELGEYVLTLLGSTAVNLMYFKRYRMEIALKGRDFSPPRVPEGYHFVAWRPDQLDSFAEAKYHSFRNEIDANVFPCLGDFDGCRRLMREIVRKPGFLRHHLALDIRPRRPPARTLRHRAGHSRRQRPGIDPEPGHRAGAP